MRMAKTLKHDCKNQAYKHDHITNVDVQQSGLKRQKYSFLKIRYTQQF